MAPRFNSNVKVIQKRDQCLFLEVDIVPEEFHQNVPTTVPLLGDIGETLYSMLTELDDWKYSENSKWMMDLLANAQKNRDTVERMAADHSVPLNYYAAYTPIRKFLEQSDVLVVNEGANTMDIGRTMMPSVLPRSRLDAGTFGTMGVGHGYSLAAALYCRDHSPKTKVLVVQGDSAFGFSAMELETIARYPVLSLSAECRYDELCKALGGDGYFVRSVPEIEQALAEAFRKTDGPSVINVIISTDSERKAQLHPWLARSKV
ncbi:unnamed protein product [Haemonchus placei]|uniref:2-hydroxyacyl-CoA lyase n=1 Tax=Haemonchus placei TaxID=6290 RepID=A0A3P7SFX0_HAEPC|nr:unnamed protein product [Haemonchus placei]